MPSWVTSAYADYSKRLPKELKPQLLELPLGKRSQQTPPDKAIQREGETMLAAIPAQSYVIALDIPGKAYTTAQLATQLTAWQQYAKPLVLLIGGPDGLAPACLARANSTWSLSPLTLPHPLVRIIVIEQLYRAWSILQHHPYHRA